MNFLTRLFTRRPPLDRAFADCTTPKDVCAVVRSWVYPCETNDTDRPDLETVWRRGYGDCDDMARLVKYGCESIGIPTQVWWCYEMFSKQLGHALAYSGFPLYERSWYSTNGEFHKICHETETIESIAARILGCDRVWSRKMD